jgi:hypothetical protein
MVLDSVSEYQAVPFTEWCLELGFRMTPAQLEASRVAFDGHDPSEQWRDVLFGGRKRVAREARRDIVEVAGRASGKSRRYAMRLLHLGLTVPLRLAPGERAYGLIVAPDMRLARKTLEFVSGIAAMLPAGMVQRSGAESVTLRRADGELVVIECLPATAGGSAVRGRTLVGALLDECAFFRDNTHAVNDVDLYRSVSPRIVPGGQVLIASTPWGKLGLLWDFFEAAYGKEGERLVLRAPTLLMRDNDPEVAAEVAREKARDPDNARREFDAEFLSSRESAFFDERAIDAAVDASILLPSPRKHSAIAAVSADWGFKQDSSALVAVQRDADMYEVSSILEMVPGEQPLKPSSVVSQFAVSAKTYSVEDIVSDGHYEEAIREHLVEHDLDLIRLPDGANGKADTYQVARSLLNEGRVRIPKHDRLLRQLREVISRPTSGGGVSIQSPRRKGAGHGDIVSALVGALWYANRLQPVAERKRVDKLTERRQRVDEQFRMAEANQRRRYDEETWSDGWNYE